MNKRLLVLFFAAGVTLLMGGCKKYYLDINDNPNDATFSTPQLTMPIALENAGRVSRTSYNSIAFWVGYWATSSGFSKPSDVYTYDVANTFMQGLWDNLYNNITDLNYVEQAAKEEGFAVYEAIAKVMKAYDYQQLVDVYGNVPYYEAIQGADNLTPGFTDAQQIYESLVRQLDSAIVILNKPATAGTMALATDKQRLIVFNNLITTTSASATAFTKQWVRFANTMKLKLLVQQSQIPGRDAYIKANLLGLTSADFLQIGEDAVANPGYINDPTKWNPFYGVFYNASGATDSYKSIRASKYGADQYNATNDPRISFFYDKTPAAASTVIGNEFGDPVGTTAAAYVGAGLLSPTKGILLLSAAESLFLQAEAVQRGYITGDAQALYQQAVEASFTYTGVPNPATAAAAYTAQASADVNWSVATDKIRLIITQKWFALNGLDILAVWNDYRRTGFPPIPLSTDPGSKGKIPLRLFYPLSEEQKNASNVAAQGAVDIFSTPIFWDK